MFAWETRNSKNIITTLRIVTIEKSELTFFLILYFHGFIKIIKADLYDTCNVIFPCQLRSGLLLSRSVDQWMNCKQVLTASAVVSVLVTFCRFHSIKYTSRLNIDVVFGGCLNVKRTDIFSKEAIFIEISNFIGHFQTFAWLISAFLIVLWFLIGNICSLWKRNSNLKIIYEKKDGDICKTAKKETYEVQCTQ